LAQGNCSFLQFLFFFIFASIEASLFLPIFTYYKGNIFLKKNYVKYFTIVSFFFQFV